MSTFSLRLQGPVEPGWSGCKVPCEPAPPCSAPLSFLMFICSLWTNEVSPSARVLDGCYCTVHRGDRGLVGVYAQPLHDYCIFRGEGNRRLAETARPPTLPGRSALGNAHLSERCYGVELIPQPRGWCSSGGPPLTRVDVCPHHRIHRLWEGVHSAHRCPGMLAILGQTVVGICPLNLFPHVHSLSPVHGEDRSRVSGCHLSQ